MSTLNKLKMKIKKMIRSVKYRPWLYHSSRPKKGNHGSRPKTTQQFGVFRLLKGKERRNKTLTFSHIFFIPSVTKTFIAPGILILIRK